jgi:aminodeoxyfutalosine deaminase
MFLRARYLLPLNRPPVENGAVLISGYRICAHGLFHELRSQTSEPVVDLGDSILLPGLINAHCHLDYTGMAGQIPPPKNFPDWIKAILSLKAHWSYTEYAESWLAGSRMLIDSGVSTVCDIEAIPELLPETRSATPLRLFSFLEMTGVKAGRPARDLLFETLRWIEKLPGCRIGLSPHAPYSTTPELLTLAAQAARKHDLPLTTHVAESREEFEMFTARRGPLYQWLKNQRNMDDCGLGTPVEHMARHGILSPRTLAAHLNYLGPNDAALLKQSGATVVHCPRSHLFFGHHPFPLERLEDHGVPVCLGTDSLASVKCPPRQGARLDLFAEMQTFAAAYPDVSPAAILEMVTRRPARALGLAGKTGEIGSGAWADLIVIPIKDQTAGPFENVLQHAGPVAGSLINGKWAISPFDHA